MPKCDFNKVALQLVIVITACNCVTSVALDYVIRIQTLVVFLSRELDCISCSFCCASSSVRFEVDSFVMVLKVFSVSGRLLAFLIFFIAVII